MSQSTVPGRPPKPEGKPIIEIKWIEKSEKRRWGKDKNLVIQCGKAFLSTWLLHSRDVRFWSDDVFSSLMGVGCPCGKRCVISPNMLVVQT